MLIRENVVMPNTQTGVFAVAALLRRPLFCLPPGLSPYRLCLLNIGIIPSLSLCENSFYGII